VEEIDLSVEDDVTLLYFTVSQVYAALVQGARAGTNEIVCNTLLDGQDAPLDTMAAMIRQVSTKVNLLRWVDSFKYIF